MSEASRAAGPSGATGPSRANEPSRAAGPPLAALELRAFLERELGEARVTVEAEGPEEEIAAVGAPASLLPRILDPGFRARFRFVERARSLGYRYAAVDVSGDTDPDPGKPAGPGKPTSPGKPVNPGAP